MPIYKSGGLLLNHSVQNYNHRHQFSILPRTGVPKCQARVHYQAVSCLELGHVSGRPEYACMCNSTCASSRPVGTRACPTAYASCTHVRTGLPLIASSPLPQLVHQAAKFKHSWTRDQFSLTWWFSDVGCLYLPASLPTIVILSRQE